MPMGRASQGLWYMVTQPSTESSLDHYFQTGAFRDIFLFYPGVGQHLNV